MNHKKTYSSHTKVIIKVTSFFIIIKVQIVLPHYQSKRVQEQGFSLAILSLGLKSKMMLSIQQAG